MLTQARLREVLDYNPTTGIFYWKRTIGRAIKGVAVQNFRHDWYVRIMVDQKRYLAHRLAWLYVYGYFPEHGVDHIDRVPSHNWIANLREVTQSCNMQNVGNMSDNTSGVKGVAWHNKSGKWKVEIHFRRKDYYLGIYKDFDDAACARLAAEQCLGWSACDNNSPAALHVRKITKRQSGQYPM